MMKTARTTINMQPALLEQLRMFAKRQEKTLSDIFEEMAHETLSKNRQERTRNMYKNLTKFRNEALKHSDPDPKYINKSVDEVLYGEEGAWTGSHKEADE
jgi:hypothetical protein